MADREADRDRREIAQSDADDLRQVDPGGEHSAGREAGLGGQAARLQHLLGLTDDELLTVLAADPLEVVSGQLEHRPELAILLDLLAEAEERAGGAVLKRWVRSPGPAGRPIDLLLARDFPAFETALATLAERGYVLRGGVSPAPGPAPPAKSR